MYTRLQDATIHRMVIAVGRFMLNVISSYPCRDSLHDHDVISQYWYTVTLYCLCCDVMSATWMLFCT